MVLIQEGLTVYAEHNIIYVIPEVVPSNQIPLGLERVIMVEHSTNFMSYAVYFQF